MQSEDKAKRSDNNEGAAIVAGVSTAAIAAHALGTVGAAAQVLGFGSGGIAAGSTAAAMMSTAATTGVGGSVVAALQSAGALFTGSVATSLIAPVAIGGAIYYLFSGSDENDESDNKQN